jgi:hypothetical protein
MEKDRSLFTPAPAPSSASKTSSRCAWRFSLSEDVGGLFARLKAGRNMALAGSTRLRLGEGAVTDALLSLALMSMTALALTQARAGRNSSVPGGHPVAAT